MSNNPKTGSSSCLILLCFAFSPTEHLDRKAFLEPVKEYIADTLGEVLVFTSGKEGSSFPNDRAYILWDVCQEIPPTVEITHRGVTAWQKIKSRTLPYHCFKCNQESVRISNEGSASYAVVAGRNVGDPMEQPELEHQASSVNRNQVADVEMNSASDSPGV